MATGPAMSSGGPLRCTFMSYADVNGLSLYYQEHGTGGEPLIMLHGGFGTGDTFGPVLDDLASTRRVITADLQAHGGTADIDRPLRFETMADDIAGLIGHLGLEHADVFGYSLGGAVALRLAIQHPQLVRRLVLMSVPAKRDGWFPEVRAGFDTMGRHLEPMFRQSPIYPAYAKLAPRVEDFPVLIDKVGDVTRQDYDWTAEVPGITAPVMLVYGDADSVTLAHIAEFYALLGGGLKDGNWDGSARPAARLAIMPGQVHTDMLTAPGLPGAVSMFLDAPVLVPSPMGQPPMGQPPMG
jgi:pimeloyl-ACP methyl ester carboxylesterase